MMFSSEDENVDVGEGDEHKVGVEEEDHDHPEWVPERELVQSSTIHPVSLCQEVWNVEIVLLFLPHTPMILLGYS